MMCKHNNKKDLRHTSSSTLQQRRVKQPQIFFPHSCHSTAARPKGLKKKKKNNVAYLEPCTYPFFFSARTTSLWTFPARATHHRISRVGQATHVCRCVYLGWPPVFFSTTPHSITLYGRDAFSNRWWPMAALFSLSRPCARCVPCICFPRFFSLFYRCTHYPTFCFRPSVSSFIFHGPWPAALSSTARRRFFT